MTLKITLNSLGILLISSVLIFSGCGLNGSDPGGHSHQHGGHDANVHMNQRPFEELARDMESAERVQWQKPYKVLGLLGDLRDKTVIDIGSGTGYFSFKLAELGAKVIAADVDSLFLSFIEQRMIDYAYDSSRIEVRKVPYDDPMLADGETDIALIVNTYHHIDNREEYFKKVRKGLKPGGKIMVVDFKKKPSPQGPPINLRIEGEDVLKELEKCGFGSFYLDRSILDYQYILIGTAE